MAVVITVLSFNSVRSELPSSIQHKLMDLSGVISITNIPKLETTVQRNQFFDNYSALSIPDIKTIDQTQLQNIQTFSPSHRKISLGGLYKIKDITSGLVLQDVTVTPEDFKGIGMQDGKIVVPNIADKSQQVKDILEATNTILQEVKSLNQKELNSLKLTISDMRNMQKIMPIIQQQLDGSTFKDEKINGVSADVDAMTAEMSNAKKELFTLIPNLTFADFDQMANAGVSTNGKLILPNYNKDTASNNLNRFIEISNQGSKYVDAELLSATPSLADINTFSGQPHTFVMKGPESVTGKKNGFLNIVPDLGMAAKIFDSNLSSAVTSAVPVFNWDNNSGSLLTANTANGLSGAQLLSAVADTSLYNTNLVSANTGPSAFEYMSNTSFATFETFQDKPLLPFPNMSLNNDLGGLCPIGTACRQKLSIGDLNGAFNEMMNNLPEDARPR